VSTGKTSEEDDYGEEKNLEGTIEQTAREAEDVADQLGYPVVLKILSDDISHKTDVGGVVTDIYDRDQLRNAWENIYSSVTSQVPDAAIDGMSVQKQVDSKIDLIVGALRDPGFGPLVSVGLGGVFTEALEDVAFRMAPVDRCEAVKMMRDTTAWSFIENCRGVEVDVDTIVDVIVKLSRAISEHDCLDEIEINPFVIDSSGRGISLDALVSIDPDEL